MEEDALWAATILIVDDQAPNVRLLEYLLQAHGYLNVRTTTDSRQVLTLFRECAPDLVLLDLAMPHPDGFAVMEGLRPLMPPGAYVPILVLTADVSAETKTRALAAGAKDFVTKPFDRTEVLLRIRNLLEARALHRQLQEQNRTLEEQVRRRTKDLLQAEKLAAMGQLLAGVAHELNNPLAVVIGQADLLHGAAGDGPTAARAEKIMRAADRCGRIVKNFLALARQQPMEREPTSLNRVVQEAVELLAYPLRVDDVEVRLDLAPALPPIWADPHQLHQVIVNLVSNAHQAMRATPAGRRVTLATRLGPGPGQVRMEIADTGPGIPSEIRARIFEPFFTTKPPGQGTGLGLSLCAGIVEGHGGRIRLRSQPGEGAAFQIELPIDPRREPRPIAVGPASLVLIRGKRVLVVDDEPEVAELLEETLCLDGHHVEIAADGQGALDKLRDGAYDLILSDLKMPGLSGPDFYRELRRLHPELDQRVVFVTGDALSGEVAEFLDETGVPTLHKPFSLEDLRRIVGSDPTIFSPGGGRGAASGRGA